MRKWAGTLSAEKYFGIFDTAGEGRQMRSKVQGCAIGNNIHALGRPERWSTDIKIILMYDYIYSFIRSLPETEEKSPKVYFVDPFIMPRI